MPSSRASSSGQILFPEVGAIAAMDSASRSNSSRRVEGSSVRLASVRLLFRFGSCSVVFHPSADVR